MSEQVAPVTQVDAPAENNAQDSSHSNAPAQEKPKPEKRWHEVKVNGQTRKVDEETLLRDYSKFSAADQRFQEAARMAKSAETFIEALQKNPEAILADPRLPINKRELAMKWLREEIQNEIEPPDPRDAKTRQLEEELNRYRQKEQEELTQREHKQYQDAVEQRREALASTLSKAMELTPLSKNPKVRAETISEMAAYLRMCRRAGYDVSPEELAQHVASNHQSRWVDLADSLEGDDLINILGERVVAKLRKADLARLRKQREAQAPETAPEGEWQSSAGERKKREIVDPHQLMRKK